MDRRLPPEAHRRAQELLQLAATVPHVPVRLDLEFQPHLTASRGKLLSLGRRGTPVHAGSFLRQSRIVLDSQLLRRPAELRRVFLHEMFHFIWWRLGNPRRLAYEQLLASEFDRRVPGELGWSAESRKARLTRNIRRRRERLWREYCCESFCDTGAWLHGPRRHSEITLAAPERGRRRALLRKIL